MVLSAVLQSGERFGAGYIIDLLRGAKTQKIISARHDQLKIYGAGKEQNKAFWTEHIDELIIQGYLKQADGKYPVLQCSEESQALLRGERTFSISKEKAAITRRPAYAAPGGTQINRNLFEHLRSLRWKLAQREKIPPYIIFSDRTLHEMSAQMPLSKAELLKISGVGEIKLEHYGDVFLRAISEFLKEHPSVKISTESKGSSQNFTNTENPSFQSSAKPIGETGEETWRLLQGGLGIEEIASRRMLSSQTVRGHIENLIRAGREIDIDRFVPPDKRRQIEDLFHSVGSSKLSPVWEASGGKFSYDELGLVRAWMNRPGRKT
jgi:ATP-dependent DNA helicase RecQ